MIYDYFLEETKWDEFGDDDSARNRYINDCLKASDQVIFSDKLASLEFTLRLRSYIISRSNWRTLIFALQSR